jgi:hypothetical protein
MSEVPLQRCSGGSLKLDCAIGSVLQIENALVQECLAHKNPTPPWNLQKPYAQGPTAILGGWVFLMSEVPLDKTMERGGPWRLPRVQI